MSDPELLVDGKPCPATIVREVRQDVCAALGVAPTLAHGFVLTLPADIWRADGKSRAVMVAAAGKRVDVNLPRSIDDWLASLRDLAPGEELERSLRFAVQHVAALGGIARRPTELAEWLDKQAGQRGYGAALSDPSFQFSTRPALVGNVEALDGLVVRGWAWSGGAATEQITLRAQGVDLEASVIRTSRDDVQKATGAQRVTLGFEIEIPGRLWRTLGHASSLPLEVVVNGQVLSGTQVLLSAQGLLDEVKRLRSDQVLLDAGGISAIDPHEHQYRLLLTLEHLGESGLRKALQPDLAEFAARHAERFGLAGILATTNESLVETLIEVPIAPLDYTTSQAWALLRDFNERLHTDDADPERLLDAILREKRPQSEARHRFLLSLIPYFCGQASYVKLRPHLSVWRLRGLAEATNAWERSLLLPEWLSAGDLKGAATLISKLTASREGWLNTECVAEACRILLAQQAQSAAEAGDVTDFVESLLLLVESLCADPWDRGHDLHLIDSMVSLIELIPALDQDLAAGVVKTAIKAYALAPAFWSRLARRWPDSQHWPVPLQNLRGVLPRLEQFLMSAKADEPASLWPVLPFLRMLHRAGNFDVPQWIRELVQATAGQLVQSQDAAAAYAELGAISGADALRLAANPMMDPTLLATAPDLKQCIRELSGVPATAAVQPLSAMFALAMAARGAVPSLQACLEQSGARYHWIGVYWQAVRWCLNRAISPEVDQEAELSVLRESWRAAIASLAPGVTQPAAVSNAYSCLMRESRRDPSYDLERLLAEMRMDLGAAAPLLGRPDRESLRWTGVGAGVLVAIYSCRSNLSTRVARIRETWAAHLTRRGIPWVVVVGDGDGQLEEDVLALPVSDAYEDLPAKTLALVHWVYQQTSFDHLLKIDDDCHLAVDAFFTESPHLSQHYLGRRLHRAEGGTDRRWHQSKSQSERGRHAIDKSPEPSIYADGGAGYCLSRYAMGSLVQVLESTGGARLARSAFMEDKLVGDLLKRCGIELSSTGYETLVRRRWGSGATPVNSHQNVFFPSLHSPTLVSHLDDAEQLSGVELMQGQSALLPARIWPSDREPVLGGVAGTNQLELLSGLEGVKALRAAEVIVVAVARNESVLMPHFLAHYRNLGVRHFVLVDNLSDDGTREYLLTQGDVVLYSADTEYRYSHYGVAWQKAVLGAHALGKWVVLADIDEFLVYPDSEKRSITNWLKECESLGSESIMAMMVDMYPEGDLELASFESVAPFEIACHFDRRPFIAWRLGSGWYSNGPTFLSGLRHRLIPNSAPNLYTAQKVAIFRYMPWIRLSEGLHYASNATSAEHPVVFAHFKYHAGFKRKVQEEVSRKQHFNGAEEYQKYLHLVRESGSILNTTALSNKYMGSASYEEIFKTTINFSAF